MALPSTVYRANIELSDVDRGVYEQLEATVARHPSETEERLVARLLAYAVCYREGLVFTRGIAAGDEPDLWLKSGDGRVECWVEVGLPDPERLQKATRHAGRVILLACGAALPRWRDQHQAKLAGMAKLTVICIDQSFLNAVVSRLQRSLAWSITITEGTLYLAVNGETLETALQYIAQGC